MIKKTAFKIGSATLLATCLLFVGAEKAHAVAAALVNVANTLSSPAVVLDARHASPNQVTLTISEANPVFAHQAFAPLSRMFPGGGTDDTQYVVPSGQNLVITDIELTPVQNMNDFLQLAAGTQSGYFSLNNLQFTAGTHIVSLQNGYVVPAGTPLGVTNYNDAAQVYINVHGYLTPM